MNCIPLNTIPHEVVIMRAFLVVDAIEMRVKTTLEPPGSLIVLRTVVVKPLVVVLVTCTERHVVMTLPFGGHGISRVAAVTMDMQTIIPVLVVDTEVLILGPVVPVPPVGHFDS